MEQWNNIINALKAAGLTAFAPGGHIGVCTAPYCVVQPCGGTMEEKSPRGGRAVYRIYLVVPCDMPQQLDVLATAASAALNGLITAGTLQLAVPRGQTMIDNGFMALISSMDYYCYYSERNNI